MNAQSGESGGRGKTDKRTSPVRVSPLVAIQPYQGDLDFGTNYMSVEAGGDPNIYETEIHGGLYRGTILIELDRVGAGDGFEGDLDASIKAKAPYCLARCPTKSVGVLGGKAASWPI